MSFDTPWYIDQQDILDKQSTVSTEDISKTAKNESNAHKIREKAINIKQKEEIEAETSINQALWEEYTPVNWEDNERSIRESGIDFKSKIAQIDVQIVQIQTKIDLLLQKNNLSEQDQMTYLLLDEKLEKLTAEKLAIIDNRIENKKETVAIKQTEEKQIDKTVAIKQTEEKQIDNSIDKHQAQLTIKWKEILDRTNKMKSFIDILPNTNWHKKVLLGKITEMQEAKTDIDIERLEKELIQILKNPWTLLSIAKDFGWVDTEEYTNFKESALRFAPSLQEDFDRVEMNVIWNIAKLKLWTSDLEGVDLDKHILSKEEDGVVTSYSDKKGRYLNSVWGDFSLKSELNPDNEKKLGEVNSKVREDLEPLNESLNLVNKILEYLRKAEQNGEDFEEVKKMIQVQNPDFYTEQWLDNITSFNEMIMILDARKYELEEEKEDLKQEAKEKIARIIQKSEKEAEQKDKVKKDTLKFLHSIGFDMFSNSDVDGIIRQINKNKSRFSISEDIDLAKWNLGTKYDSGNNVERKNFARIVNILFSAGENEPIDLSSIWAMWSPIFKVGWEVKDYGKFMTGIKEKVGTNKRMFLQNNFDNFVKQK